MASSSPAAATRHGVGMSQRGAQRMAGVYGKTCEEILSFYYPGVEWVALEWEDAGLTQIDALPESLGYAKPPRPRRRLRRCPRSPGASITRPSSSRAWIQR